MREPWRPNWTWLALLLLLQALVIGSGLLIYDCASRPHGYERAEAKR